MKHTKGEWVINYTAGFIWSQLDGSRIVEFENDTINFHIPRQTERRANAKLIAQSPIMFDYIQKKANNGCKKAKEIVVNVLNN